MFGLETIIGGAIAFIVAIAGTWFAAKRVGRSDATADVAQRDAERVVRANQQAADAQVKAANQSTEVRDAVSTLDDGAAAGKLRDAWSRD